MSVGLNPSKSEIDAQAGAIARNLQTTFYDIENFLYYLQGKTDQNLLDLGYIQSEIDTLRSAFADLSQLQGLYEGGSTLNSVKDFRTFVRRIFGLGAVGR